ncbi:hypothetical protein CPAR01_01916 [Colletotrichum paranaense]|uniref:Uncharacterized protein n=1 Tax=Colletotrichum paranaense TaxID=1914294 RepID=A0ABQ9SY24_9PEZI|nr:uncharacterized protein CPAR01_01916 [Colletotrichum paranaense]KAK1544414.1 hypothetical protein CPAR01_01916 [Colletotrichum paranaense]
MNPTQQESERHRRQSMSQRAWSRGVPLDNQPSPDILISPPLDHYEMSPRPISTLSQLTDEDTSWDRPLLSSRTKSVDEETQRSSGRRTSDWSYAKVTGDLQDQYEGGLGPTQHRGKQDSRSTLPGMEGSKISKPITRTEWSRYFNGWIVHLPAILVTTAVLLIGSIQFYWYPEIGPLVSGYRLDTDIISNILQFVAKLHELLIVASLSSIALAMYRRRLVTTGVRLGFLTGGYRVGDLNYLRTSSFRHQGLNRSKPWEMLLPGFLVFATILSTIVGPASAVLLLPSLGWYEFDTSSAFSKIEPPLLYWWNRRAIWFRDPFSENTECQGPAGVYRDYCPAGGFPVISSWVRDYAATDLTNNLTFYSTSSDIRRHLVFTQADDKPNTSSTTLTTTPSHFLMTSIGLFQQFIHSSDVGALSREPRYRITAKGGANVKSPTGEGSGFYQPFVQSRCTIHDKGYLADTPGSISFPTKSINCFDDADCLQSQRKPREFNEADWLNNSSLDNISASSTFFLDKENSTVVYLNGMIPDSLSGESRNLVYICSLYASWAPSNFSMDPSVSDSLQSTFSNDRSMRDMYYGKSQEDIRVIRFRSNWFKFLNPHWNISNTTTASGVSQIILNFSSKLKVNGKTVNVLAPVDGANNTASEIFLAKVFGVYLAEGLARNSQEQRTRIKLNSTDTELTYLDLNEQHGYLGGVHKITPFNNTHHQDEWRDSTTQRNTTFAAFTEVLNTALPINFTAQRYGYGSGQGRKTLEFAQVMMLIYLGIIAVYAATVGTGYVLELLKVKSGGERIRVLSVIPWSDLQDLIVLALKTPPPSDEDLADAGAGVTSDKVWEKVVRAESDDKRNIQLAFQETTHTRKLDVSRKERYY